jgi:hypothetical protein
MKQILTACLSLGAALALATTAEAQDTTQAGAAPLPQDSAPTAQAQGDTLGGDSTKWGYPVDTSAQQNPPGYRGMETPTDDSLGDSTRIRPGSGAGDSSSTGASSSGPSAAPSSDSTGASSSGVAPDTTLPGDQRPRHPEGQEEWIHSDSAGADSSSS